MTDIESPEPTTPEPTTPEPTTPQAPAAELSVAEPSESDGAPERDRSRRTVLKATGAVVAAMLVGVGIGEGIIKVHYSDAPAQAVAVPSAAPSPSASPAWGAKSNGNHFGSMRDLLLPVPTAYNLGPDYLWVGNDAELLDKDLDKFERDEIAEVPEKYRAAEESMLAAKHIRAVGVRSLASADNRVQAVLVLRQFNQQWVAADAEFSRRFTDSELYRQGPAVAGHPEAVCALPPLEAGDQLDYVECIADVGDLLVGMEVSGVAPLDQNKVVDLFRQQLDRLAIPGASV